MHRRAQGSARDIGLAPAFGKRLAGAARRRGRDPRGRRPCLCTHLHIDHVGWNTVGSDGAWRPAFPNARYLVGDRELADWQAQMAAGTAEPIQLPGLVDSVLPLLDAGVVDLVRDGMEIATGAAIMPLPGHTPGHVGLRLDRPDARALFCGDALHSPVQILQPAASTASCRDRELAARTRVGLLGEAAATGRVLVPAHFRGSRRVGVEARDGGFRPVFPD
jgi:glyoxylase-like metal-dependent hydrolase (beta-lactamase superfamily II)